MSPTVIYVVQKGKAEAAYSKKQPRLLAIPTVSSSGASPALYTVLSITQTGKRPKLLIELHLITVPGARLRLLHQLLPLTIEKRATNLISSGVITP